MELKRMSRYESLLILPPLREKCVSLSGHPSPPPAGSEDENVALIVDVARGGSVINFGR